MFEVDNCTTVRCTGKCDNSFPLSQNFLLLPLLHLHYPAVYLFTCTFENQYPHPSPTTELSEKRKMKTGTPSAMSVVITIVLHQLAIIFLHYTFLWFFEWNLMVLTHTPSWQLHTYHVFPCCVNVHYPAPFSTSVAQNYRFCFVIIVFFSR